MHWTIDIFAAVFLLFFFLSGWRKGPLLALLGVAQVVLAYGVAYFAGRHLGAWLAEVLYRPRIVMIPVTAGLIFVLITFGFHLAMWKIRQRRQNREEEDGYRIPGYRRFAGGLVGVAAGLPSLVFVFWLVDLFMTGVSGAGLPGGDASLFGRFSRRAIYEGVYWATARPGRESQAAAMARAISNPAKGLDHLRRAMAAEPVRLLLSDRQLAEDVLSGDTERIGQNASVQRIFRDPATREELEELGLLSRKDTEASFSARLSGFGQNETIQASIRNLQAKDLLRTDKILLLVRDPDFDVIVGEILE